MAVGNSRLVVLLALSAAAMAPEAAAQTRRDRHGDPLPPGAVARLGTLHFRTPTPTEGIAFAPDGKTLAASCRAGVYLFDAVSGKRLRRLPGSDCPWSDRDRPVFSPDGKRLALRGSPVDDPSSEGIVRLWDLAGEHKPRDYEATSVVWLGWSAQSEPLAVCLERGGLRLQELAAGRSRRFECSDLPRPDKDFPPLCAWAPAGHVLVIADHRPNTIHVWDTVTGRHRGLRFSADDSIGEVALSPDGSKLVAQMRHQLVDQRAVLWDVKTGRQVQILQSTGMWGHACFTADGKTIAVVGDGDVSLWDAASGRLRSRLTCRHAVSGDLAISPDGNLLASHNGSTIHVWDVATRLPRAEPAGHCGPPQQAVFSLDGRRVLTGYGPQGALHVWDAATGTHLLDLPPPIDEIRCAIYSADGRQVFLASGSRVWVCDAATGKRRHEIQLEDRDDPYMGQNIVSLHLSDDGRTLVAVSFAMRTDPIHMETLIVAWDVSTWKEGFRRKRPVRPISPQLSADISLLAVFHKGSVQVEDVRTGKVLRTFSVPNGSLWPQAFSPDARFLATLNIEDEPGNDHPIRKTVRVWEVATASEVFSLPTWHFAPVAFSAESRLLAVVNPQQEIVIRDLPRGCEVRRLKGFDAQVSTLAFSSDGRHLVSGLSDSTLLVWDVKDCANRPKAPLGPDALARAWADLAGFDTPRALQARAALASAADEAMPLLEKQVHSAAPVKLPQLLADLDSDQFSVREKAQADLEDLGELAEPALRQVLENQPTLEVRRRVEKVLQSLRGPVRRPEALRALRAVAVLEDIATPQACRLLEKLAAGAPEARLSREAKASLRRLQHRGGAEHGQGK